MIDGVVANGEGRQIDHAIGAQERPFDGVDMEADPAVGPGEQNGVQAAAVDVVHQGVAAIGAHRHRRGGRGDHRVGFGNRGAVEARRDRRHVDDAVAQRGGLFEHADGLRAAAHVDGHHPRAAPVDLLDEAEEALRIDEERGEGVDRGQAVLAGRRAGREGGGDRKQDGAERFHGRGLPVAVFGPVPARGTGGRARHATTPRKLRTSRSVRRARWNDTRRLRAIAGRFSGGWK